MWFNDLVICLVDFKHLLLLTRHCGWHCEFKTAFQDSPSNGWTWHTKMQLQNDISGGGWYRWNVWGDESFLESQQCVSRHSPTSWEYKTSAFTELWPESCMGLADGQAEAISDRGNNTWRHGRKRRHGVLGTGSDWMRVKSRTPEGGAEWKLKWVGVMLCQVPQALPGTLLHRMSCGWLLVLPQRSFSWPAGGKELPRPLLTPHLSFWFTDRLLLTSWHFIFVYCLYPNTWGTRSVLFLAVCPAPRT